MAKRKGKGKSKQAEGGADFLPERLAPNTTP
jgi:hypothetical protein